MNKIFRNTYKTKDLTAASYLTSIFIQLIACIVVVAGSVMLTTGIMGIPLDALVVVAPKEPVQLAQHTH